MEGPAVVVYYEVSPTQWPNHDLDHLVHDLLIRCVVYDLYDGTTIQPGHAR